MECGFMHIPAVGEVTSFTYDDSTRLLTLTGTDLPDNLMKVQSITFAGSTCTPTADSADAEGVLSGTSVVCKLDREATCGTWVPALTTHFGNVANGADITGAAVPCTISSVVPDTPLNLLGQDNITFTGTNFPH
jgi:hypothetical protein